MIAEGGWREMLYIHQDNENSGNANEDAMGVIDRYPGDNKNQNGDWYLMLGI